MKKGKDKERAWADYYEEVDILDELMEEPVEFSLDDQLCQDILAKRRKRDLQNVTVKMDPFHFRAIRKLATIKSIPCQTLIRHWLAEKIKQEIEDKG